MRLFQAIGRIADNINSIGSKGIFIIIITVSVVIIGMFFLPEISPVLKGSEQFIETITGFPLTTGFFLAVFMFIFQSVADDIDYFILGWQLGAVGLMQYWTYHAVIAAKVYIYNNPKQSFFFNTGYTNIDVVLNVTLVIVMIVSFFAIPIFCTRYIEENEHKPKFYALSLGMFISFCLINVTEIYIAVTGWLLKKG